MTGGGPRRGSGTALLAKACDVLEAVGMTPGGMAQAELAARLGLPRTTLYRILGALVERGLLRQDEGRRVYTPGSRLLEIAQRASVAPDLASVAAPELRALRDITGETAYIAALDGREVVSLGKVEGAHEVRSAARLGQRKPLHCTSQGKAILAFLPGPERDGLVRGMKLPALTPRTITTRRALLAALDGIRARGFAVDDEEIVDGIRCVGAPVLDPEGRVAGAVSVAGPAWRMTSQRAELLGAEMAAAGRRIGALIRPVPQGAAGIRVLHGTPAFQGIDPCWSAADGCVWWADALAPEVRCLRLQGPVSTAIRWDAPIRTVAATDGGVLVLDEAGLATVVGPAGRVGPGRPVAPGILALAAAPDGTAWAAMTEAGNSAVGPLTPEGRFDPAWRLAGDVAALAWSADGTALHAATPHTGTVHRLEPGRAGSRVLARLPAGSGTPVALAADAEGQVWVALRNGWSVARLGRDGEVERVVALPVPHPTGLAFGGGDLRTLFVTTARHGVELDVLASAPLCGQTLMIDVGTAGALLPSIRWL